MIELQMRAGDDAATRMYANQPTAAVVYVIRTDRASFINLDHHGEHGGGR